MKIHKGKDWKNLQT